MVIPKGSVRRTDLCRGGRSPASPPAVRPAGPFVPEADQSSGELKSSAHLSYINPGQ